MFLSVSWVKRTVRPLPASADLISSLTSFKGVNSFRERGTCHLSRDLPEPALRGQREGAGTTGPQRLLSSAHPPAEQVSPHAWHPGLESGRRTLRASGATPRAPRPRPELPAQRLTLSPHYPTRRVPPNHLRPVQLCFQQGCEPGWGREASRTSAMPSSPRPLGAQMVKSIGSPGHPPPWGQEDCASFNFTT